MKPSKINRIAAITLVTVFMFFSGNSLIAADKGKDIVDQQFQLVLLKR